MQRPRIPIWVAGTWPKRPPFRRASRYDGVIPVAGDVRSVLSTAQVEEITAYVRQCCGEADTPYEIVYSAVRHRRAVILIKESSRRLPTLAPPGGSRPCFRRIGRLSGCAIESVVVHQPDKAE